MGGGATRILARYFPPAYRLLPTTRCGTSRADNVQGRQLTQSSSQHKIEGCLLSFRNRCLLHGVRTAHNALLVESLRCLRGDLSHAVRDPVWHRTSFAAPAAAVC